MPEPVTTDPLTVAPETLPQKHPLVTVLLMQACRFVVLIVVMNIPWIQNYTLLVFAALVGFDFWLLVRLLGKVLENPGSLAAEKPSSTGIRRTAKALVLVGVLVYLALPAIVHVLLQEAPPGPDFADGKSIGPVTIDELQQSGGAGFLGRAVIEFSDGKPRHDLGAKTTYRKRKYRYRDEFVVDKYYADPYVDDDWTLQEPVSVWVIHREGEEITEAHRYGYVVSFLDLNRPRYRYAVEMSMQDFDLKSASDAMIVMLSTQPPSYRWGLSYLQILLLAYLAAGVPLGIGYWILGAMRRADVAAAVG